MRKRAAPPGECPAGLVPAGRRDRRATSRAPAGARAIRRLCSRIRLVAEVDGRRLAHASGRQGLASRPPSGCADEVNERWHRPPIARSWVVASDAAPRKRAALAKARKRSTHRRKALWSCRPVGLRPTDPRKLLSLTRQRWRLAWCSLAEELGFGRGSTQRGATESVRGYVAGSVRGRKHRRREVPHGEAVDRSTRQDHAVPRLTWKCPELRLWRHPRREAAARLKLEVRRQAKLYPGRSREAFTGRTRAAWTGGPQGSMESAPGNRRIRGVLVA